jgi:excisionase family DNA binding protein
MPRGEEGRWLSLKEAAVKSDVSVGTMRRWIKRQEIKARKVGGLWRIRPEDLEAKWRE